MGGWIASDLGVLGALLFGVLGVLILGVVEPLILAEVVCGWEKW